MALNTIKCNYLTPLHCKGLIVHYSGATQQQLQQPNCMYPVSAI